MKQLNEFEIINVAGGEVGATGMGGNTAYTGEYATTLSVTGEGYTFTYEVWDQAGVINTYGQTPTGDTGWSSCWVSGDEQLQCTSASGAKFKAVGG